MTDLTGNTGRTTADPSTTPPPGADRASAATTETPRPAAEQLLETNPPGSGQTTGTVAGTVRSGQSGHDTDTLSRHGQDFARQASERAEQLYHDAERSGRQSVARAHQMASEHLWLSLVATAGLAFGLGVLIGRSVGASPQGQWSDRIGQTGGQNRFTPQRGAPVMTSPREHLVDWLRDAYAMEQQALKMMQGLLARLEQYPALEARLRAHVEETRRQAEQIRECLHQLGTDTSALKTTVSSVVGALQALSGIPASDEVIKGVVFSHGFEQWEAANYRVLIATADRAGEPQIRSVLEGILREEEAMAAWFVEQTPAILNTYLDTGDKS
jgi:ferritin-like metal-binding protein YciE